MTTVSKPYAGQTLRLSHGLILQADKEMTNSSTVKTSVLLAPWVYIGIMARY